jgi:hypothetical protein
MKTKGNKANEQAHEVVVLPVCPVSGVTWATVDGKVVAGHNAGESFTRQDYIDVGEAILDRDAFLKRILVREG